MEDQLVLLEGQHREVTGIPAGFYKNKTRPTYGSAEIMAMVANGLMPQIIQWGGFKESDMQEVSEQLINVLRSFGDGYEMAKALDDRYSWDSDSELVDILEGADFHSATRTAVLAWIIDNDIKAKFEVGRQVQIKPSPRDSAMKAGEIVDICEDGNYCVMIPELGHVREGLGTHGMLFAGSVAAGGNGRASTC